MMNSKNENRQTDSQGKNNKSPIYRLGGLKIYKKTINL